MVWNFAKITIWACVDFLICHLLAIFPTVFSFRWPLFRRRKPKNITGAFAGDLRFHCIKTLLYYTVFYTPFQITIVLSYRAAMFVLNVDTFKARAMFAPRSRAVKKIYGASLRRVQLIVNINHDHGCTLTVSYITLRVSTSFVLCRKKKENKLTSACSPQANRSAY